ncbi:PRC-barrel domain-containing protein [Streptomyces sp. NPDC001407]|uniref:PRC-barrel domain-containing protein n=1 Tax=unclassified Streptomyces TaxID=2593676 RepID=UPI00340E47DA
MLFSHTRGLPVVTADEAVELGTVDALTIDTDTKCVGHLLLSGARHGGPSALPWSRVRAVGPDAVIVHSTVTVGGDPAPDPAGNRILGARVLTDLGEEHGAVEDIAFDARTGRIGTLHTTRGNVPGERLIGLGSYALVVGAD